MHSNWPWAIFSYPDSWPALSFRGARGALSCSRTSFTQSEKGTGKKKAQTARRNFWTHPETKQDNQSPSDCLSRQILALAMTHVLFLARPGMPYVTLTPKGTLKKEHNHKQPQTAQRNCLHSTDQGGIEALVPFQHPTISTTPLNPLLTSFARLACSLAFATQLRSCVLARCMGIFPFQGPSFCTIRANMLFLLGWRPAAV
jgi:hypothetical protein